MKLRWKSDKATLSAMNYVHMDPNIISTQRENEYKDSYFRFSVDYVTNNISSLCYQVADFIMQSCTCNDTCTAELYI